MRKLFKDSKPYPFNIAIRLISNRIYPLKRPPCTGKASIFSNAADLYMIMRRGDLRYYFFAATHFYFTGRIKIKKCTNHTTFQG